MPAQPDLDPTIGAVHYNTGNYLALPDDFVPYHYEDEVSVLPLLGRDAMLADRNEVLQTSARRAETCTFSVLVQGETDKATLAALWATATTHNLADGAGSRNVAVVKVDTQLVLWSTTTPLYKVTVTTRTR